MKDSLRAALAQVNTTVGDFKNNVEKIQSCIKLAVSSGCEIITFPELSLCGYPPEDLLFKDGFVEDSLKALDELARHAPGNITAAVGCLDREGPDELYNACALVHGGRVRAVYRKAELPNYGVFDEKRYFMKGKSPLVFSINNINAAVNICEDIWLDGVAERQAAMGARVIFNISASPFHLGKKEKRFELISSKAKKLKIPICYNNAVGGQDEIVFDGASFAVDAGGRRICSAGQFAESILICDIEAGGKKQKPKPPHVFDMKPVQKPPLEKKPVKDFSEAGQMYGALVLGTGDYVRKNGFKKALLGISGGIDSALTAAVAVDALGSENLTGVLMPSRYSSPETTADSTELAKLLNIRLLNISIEPAFTASLDSLQEAFGDGPRGLAEENLQARIRGNLLMALSNKFGWILLTTGNKSELSCGYCTLYGDMAGGFAVLKDIYKTSVYALAEYRNSLSPAIPRAIMEKHPTAELRFGQKDQDTLPPYEILDKILMLYIEKNKNLRQLSDTGLFDRETLARVISMVDSSEYKRRQSPPGVKITPRSFGKDRRMPITNLYRQ